MTDTSGVDPNTTATLPGLLPSVAAAYQNDPRRALVAALSQMGQSALKNNMYNGKQALANAITGSVGPIMGSLMGRDYQNANQTALDTNQRAMQSLITGDWQTAAKIQGSNQYTAAAGQALATKMAEKHADLVNKYAEKGWTLNPDGSITDTSGAAPTIYKLAGAQSGGEHAGGNAADALPGPGGKAAVINATAGAEAGAARQKEAAINDPLVSRAVRTEAGVGPLKTQEAINTQAGVGPLKTEQEIAANAGKMPFEVFRSLFNPIVNRVDGSIIIPGMDPKLVGKVMKQFDPQAVQTWKQSQGAPNVVGTGMLKGTGQGGAGDAGANATATGAPGTPPPAATGAPGTPPPAATGAPGTPPPAATGAPGTPPPAATGAPGTPPPAATGAPGTPPPAVQPPAGPGQPGAAEGGGVSSTPVVKTFNGADPYKEIPETKLHAGLLPPTEATIVPGRDPLAQRPGEEAAAAAQNKFNETDKAGTIANSQRADLQSMRTMLENGLNTDRSAPARAAISAYISTVDPALAKKLTGIDPAQAETFDAIRTRMGLNFARSTEGAREAVQGINIALGANPSPDRIKQANLQIIDLMDAAAKHDMDAQAYGNAWFDKNHHYVGSSPWFTQNHPMNEYVSQVIPRNVPQNPADLERNVTYQGPNGQRFKYDGQHMVAAPGR